MAVANYDCGDMSNVVITSDSFSGVIDITINGVVGDIYVRRNSPISFHCSGEMSIDAPLNSIHIFLSSVSLQGVWSENFLMGLAGLVCGSFLSYVLVKYAV
ncbi:MAG: hypothetical protein H8D23_38970 [Candidatus Brocadiales bacterium]|nr:hypothetical protein [Candidatus Brocadiales bacterium]